ncbi:hypothetical protein ACS0TY_000233 [Phlomoides rotata]
MRIFSLNNPCIGLSIFRKRKALQVVKIDGSVMEFKSPILVKELLIKFEGFGIKSSRKSSTLLPPNFVLKMGRTYYLIPSDEAKNRASPKVELETDTTVKRIKVVITKKQLEELLAKKTSMEKIIFGIDKACLGVNWKPSLASIPEENEISL